MATNFPGSLDSFTNPSSSSTLDSPSHAAQHANINDAMEAVQTKLGTGAGTIGEWISFTPSVPNLTVGNGDWVWAYYAIVNEILFISARFDFGSTSSLSGVFRIDTPGGLTLIENNISSGFAVLNDRGASDFRPGTLQPDDGNNNFRLVMQDYVSGWSRADVDTSTPFSWTTNDRIWLSCWAAIS